MRSTVTLPGEFAFCSGSGTATRTTGRKPCWYTCFPFSDYSTCPRQNCLSPHTLECTDYTKWSSDEKQQTKNSEIVFSSFEPQQKEQYTSIYIGYPKKSPQIRVVCSWFILKEKYIDLSPILIYYGDIFTRLVQFSCASTEWEIC